MARVLNVRTKRTSTAVSTRNENSPEGVPVSSSNHQDNFHGDLANYEYYVHYEDCKSHVLLTISTVALNAAPLPVQLTNV